jgi:predicted nucleic acid-binding protein
LLPQSHLSPCDGLFDRYASLGKRREFVAFVSMAAHFVEVRRLIRACRDPKDDKFLDVAVSDGADTVVTGDADLLILDTFEGTRIMTPAAYLGRSNR